MDWQQVKAEFEWDGTLRDLYILSADVRTWQQVVEFLRASEYACRFQLDDEELPLPADVAALFRMRPEVYALLSVNMDGIAINCHFFTEGEVEFDLDPRENDGDKKLQELLGFMRGIGQATGRAVRLAPENCACVPVFEYSPESDQVRYSPLAGRVS